MSKEPSGGGSRLKYKVKEIRAVVWQCITQEPGGKKFKINT